MKKTIVSIVAGLLLAAAAPLNAQGFVLQFDGSFSVEFQEGDPFFFGNLQSVTELSGTFSFIFDDSVVTGSGTEFFLPLSLTDLNLTPQSWGSTTFSTANVQASLKYTDGILEQVVIGGAVSGVGGVAFSEDDFSVLFLGTVADRANLSVGSEVGIAKNTPTGTIDITSVPVPEPGAYVLAAGIAALALVVLRRR